MDITREEWIMGKWIKGLALVTVAVVALAGCKATESFNDAPIAGKDDSPAEVFSMPDGFSNVASKCDGHGHRIFVAFHGDGAYAGIAVINDEACGR